MEMMMLDFKCLCGNATSCNCNTVADKIYVPYLDHTITSRFDYLDPQQPKPQCKSVASPTTFMFNH